MKKTFVILFLLLSTLCFAQGKIEIYVNGELQQLSGEAIRVKNYNDKIEIRITPSNLRDKRTLVDSIKTEGCGIQIIQKKKLVLLEPKVQQQQQQSSTRPVQKKYVVNRTLKQIIREPYLAFSCTINEITACKGKFFYLTLMFNAQRSDVNSYLNFMNQYKFYYVL